MFEGLRLPPLPRDHDSALSLHRCTISDLVGVPAEAARRADSAKQATCKTYRKADVFWNSNFYSFGQLRGQSKIEADMGGRIGIFGYIRVKRGS